MYKGCTKDGLFFKFNLIFLFYILKDIVGVYYSKDA